MNRRFSSTILSAVLFVNIFATCEKVNSAIVTLPVGNVRTTAIDPQPHPTMLGVQIQDRQTLAAYQATLPIYNEAVAGTQPVVVEKSGQIADRQALAEYQATLTFSDGTAEATK